jgi:hypothetical protein
MNSVVQQILEWATYAASTASPTQVFVPAGAWLPAGNLTGARGWGELAAKNGNFQGAPAVQFANDTRAPASFVNVQVGSNISAVGPSDPNGITSLSSSSANARYVRVGWLTSLSSGSTLATGALAGVIELIYG